MSKILLLIGALMAHGAAETCEKGQIRYSVFGQEKQEAAGYCFNATKTTLRSENCRNQDCEAFRNPRRFSFAELSSSVGKPGAALCQKIGGEFQLLRFRAGAEFYALDRCLFQGGSFVDTGTLLDFYLKPADVKK